MAKVTEEKPLIRISADEMEAFLMLPTPTDDGVYTLEQLMRELAVYGICRNIDKEKLQMLVSERMYRQEVEIAWGEPVRDGIDGYYEYKFNNHPDGKPTVCPDGSVDYWSVNSIEAVTEGQIIAVYHPAVEGRDGMSVLGKTIAAKRGREQLPLKGKGFLRQEDDTYTALTDGKIQMQNDRILVLPIHEIQGDADVTTGNIDFHGDVVIHGGVKSGIMIKATGTITIDGVVESCTLEAGKDIILRSGMLGGNKSSVRTKGNITAKFIEYTTVECEGDIQADVLMECTVACKGKIIMTGARGSIIGGTVKAVRGLAVTSLGNDAEKRTVIRAGADMEIYSKIHTLQKKIEAVTEELNQIELGLDKFEQLEQKRGVSYRDDPRRTSLLRMKIRDTAMIAADQEEEKKLRQMTEDSKDACVSVLKEVYPGVLIEMKDLRFNVKNSAQCVEFYRRPDKIATRECYIGVE